MSFDRFEIHTVLQDIETYLGYIKGNEMAADYLIRCHVEIKEDDASSEGPPLNTELSPGYTFPCPDSRWKVAPHAELRRFTLPGDPSDPGASYLLMQSIQQGADESWASGAAWALGLSAHAYQICEFIIAPDADALATAVQRLVDEVSEKLVVTNQDWASIDVLRGNWTGGAGYEFNKFYGKYADMTATMSLFSGKAAGGFAFATQIIHQTQVGLLAYLKGVREMLESDLTAWVEAARQPTRPLGSRWGVLADVGKIVEKASYLLDYVPIVKDVKGAAETGIEFVGNTATLALELGFDFPKKDDATPSSFQVADQIVDLMIAALRDDFAKEFQRGLDEGFAGSWAIGPDNADDGRTGADELQNGWLNDLKMADDWHLPKLKDPGSMYHEGDELW